tara:strand:- start:1124 stop:4687 length:3564 start_codon:yes stop_codon:yes gene_type:complete
MLDPTKEYFFGEQEQVTTLDPNKEYDFGADPDEFYRETPATMTETAASIGLEVVPAILGGVFGGMAGGASGSALGNYLSQQYRIGRGLQDKFGAGEFGAATVLGGVPVGKLAGIGTAGRVATRGAQGAALATGELAARTYIDEGRAPTQEEIASTLLFGGVFGGGLGAVEAKFLSDNLVEEATEGMTRLELVNKVKEKVDEAGGVENFEVGRPIINALGPRRLREVPQEGLDVEVQPRLPQPKTGSDVVIDITDTTQYAEDLVQRLENKLLLEAEGEVSKIARLKGQEVTKEISDLQNAFDAQLAEQDEIFRGLNREVNLGVQKIGDTSEINQIKERIGILDHRLGPGKGAKKERAKLQADLKRILKRNKMDVLDLQSIMRSNQGGADQPTKAMTFKDRPMKQADPISKVEKMAEEKLGSYYEKFLTNVKQGMTRGYAIPVAATGAAALGSLTQDEESDVMKAGFSPMLMALLFGSMGARQLRKFRKTPAFKRANAQAKSNPTKVEPDAVKAEKIQDVADKAMYVRQNQFKKIASDAKDFISDAFVPLSRKLKNIDPILNSIFRSHEKNVNIKTRQFLDRVSPFVTTMSKRLKGNKKKLREFKTNLLNGDYVAIVRMTDDLGITDKSELNEMRKALNEVRDYAREEGGIEVGYIEDYFPRQVEDYKSFKKFLDENDDFRDTRNQVEQALEDYRVKHKYESVDLIPAEEAAEVTSRVLRGFPMQPAGALPGNFKPRSIEKVDDRMLDAYADPADALKNYIERAVMATERKKFLFRKPSDQGKQVGFEGSTDKIGADLGMKMEVDESLAGQVAKRMLQGDKKYTAEDIEKLRDIIQSRFSGKTVSPAIQGLKNLNYMQVMGNFGSAITQLGDLAYSIHFNGFDNTFRSLFNQKDNFDFVKYFNLADHNIDSATSTDGLSKTLDKVFTVVGLKKLDQLAKNTTMNASWRKYKAQAKKDAPRLRDELTPVFGRERAGQMVKELQESNPTSGQLPKAVEELIWYKFLDLNPATLGEMPKFYNQSGNARIMYMLKTFTIKQFDVAREAASADIAKAKELYAQGNKKAAAQSAAKGMKGLIGLATVFAAANAGTDMIKDTLYGRPIKRDELLENNLWKLIGINRYLVMKAQRDGPAKAFLEFLLPPTAVFDRAGQDIQALAGDKEYKGAMLQGTPLDMVYWKYLGGLDKINNSN